MKKSLSNLFLSNLFFIACQVLCAQNQNSVEGHWRQVAPGMAGSNRAIYADSKNPNKLWVAPDMGNDYITLDAGKHWETIVPSDGVWSQRNTLSDVCVVSDPKDNQIVLSLKGKFINLSTDGGHHFHKIASYKKGTGPKSSLYTAYPHPTEKDTWYLGCGLDNKEVRTGVTPNPLKEIHQNESKVWKVTHISSNKRNIEPVDGTGMEAATAVFDLFAHPDVKKYPNMLFAATSTGFYRKDNAATNWVKLINGATKADYNWDKNSKTLTVYVLQQATYELQDDNLVSKGGVFKTTKPATITANNAWENTSESLYIDLTQTKVQRQLFDWMLKKWFGITHKTSTQYPTSFFQNYTDILCDPTDANKVYMSIWGGSENKPVRGPLWATSNGGKQWFAAFRAGVGFDKDTYWKSKQPEHTGRNVDLQIHKKKFPDHWRYGRRAVRSMAITADGTLYASSVKGYYTAIYNVEKDQWTSADNTYKNGYYYGHGNADTGAFNVVPDKHHPGEMFLLQYELSAWKSSNNTHPEYPGIVGVKPIPALIDKGKKWAPGQPFNTPTTVANHPTDPSVFYVMSSRTGEVMKISENGQKKEIMGEPIEVPDIIVVPKMKVVYWSDLTIANDGKTMYAVSEIIDTDNRPMGQVRIFNPKSRKGLYKSLDEGKTWTCVNNNLPSTAGGRKNNLVYGTNSAAIKSFVMDPAKENVLYAAVRKYRAPQGKSGWVQGGLFRTENGAQQWSEIKIPNGIQSVWDVWLQHKNGKPSKIYITAGGDGSVADVGIGGVWVADYKANGKYKTSSWKQIFDQHPFVSHIATSPFDENLMMIVTRETSSNHKKDAGTFYSTDGGKHWTKFNQGRGGMMIGGVAFDSGTPNRVWVACESSGIYTALLPLSN
ncbi:WD40/YVTN/BNR-like repeat-containing protein [Ochrovirga pacifica]|uniref:WD40/YVTN/BNR-like repeat-containing protein n=1 Tax=Ochrovirga pacifica TaxID=1042376 RepID=UPI0002558365|nr:hypothetical protein [Ochrovirga pacifica]